MLAAVTEVWRFTSNVTGIAYNSLVLSLFNVMLLFLVLLFRVRGLIEKAFHFECTVVLFLVEGIIIANFMVLKSFGLVGESEHDDNPLTLKMVHQIFWSTKFFTLEKQDRFVICGGQCLYIGGEPRPQALSSIPSLNSHAPSGTIVVKMSPKTSSSGSENQIMEEDLEEAEHKQLRISKFSYFQSKKDFFPTFHDIKKDFKELAGSNIPSFAPSLKKELTDAVSLNTVTSRRKEFLDSNSLSSIYSATTLNKDR